MVDEYLHRLDAMKTELRISGSEGDTKALVDLATHTAAVLQQSVDEIQRRLRVQMEDEQPIARGKLLS